MPHIVLPQDDTKISPAALLLYELELLNGSKAALRVITLRAQAYNKKQWELCELLIIFLIGSVQKLPYELLLFEQKFHKSCFTNYYYTS